MTPRPDIPTGSGRESRFMRWVYDQLCILTNITGGNGVTVSKTSRGIVVSASSKISAFAKESTGSVLNVTISTINSDYLVCTKADGGTINVAKRKPMRRSITSKVVDGITYNFSNITSMDPNNFRQSADGSTSPQFEAAHPRYVVGDKISVKRIDDSGVSSAPDWEEDEDRVWAQLWQS